MTRQSKKTMIPTVMNKTRRVSSLIPKILFVEVDVPLIDAVKSKSVGLLIGFDDESSVPTLNGKSLIFESIY